MQVLSRYNVTRPIETTSIDGQNRVVYHFSVSVVDDRVGHVVREFQASDLDSVRAAFRAVDEMLSWLQETAD